MRRQNLCEFKKNSRYYFQDCNIFLQVDAIRIGKTQGQKHFPGQKWHFMFPHGQVFLRQNLLHRSQLQTTSNDFKFGTS